MEAGLPQAWTHRGHSCPLPPTQLGEGWRQVAHSPPHPPLIAMGGGGFAVTLISTEAKDPRGVLPAPRGSRWTRAQATLTEAAQAPQPSRFLGNQSLEMP